MTNIETNAKQLAQLTKKKAKLEKSLEAVRKEISEKQAEINQQFKAIGLDTNFS